MAESKGIRLGFLWHVNLVFATLAVGTGLSFAATVIVARALGGSGFGSFELFLNAVSIAQLVLSLGAGVGAIYYIGKRTFPLRDIVSSTQFVALASVVVCGLLVLVAWASFGGELSKRNIPYWAFVFAVPLFLNFNVLASVLQGCGRFLARNLVVLTQAVAFLALASIAVATGELSAGGAVVLWSLATLAAVALALWQLGPRNIDLRRVLVPDLSLLKAQVRFGAQGQIGNLAQVLNLRLDAFIVAGFVGLAGTGVYAAAYRLTSPIWFIADAVAIVLLPRLTAAHGDDAARLTPFVCRNTLLVSAIAAGALAALSPVLVTALFGGGYGASVAPLLWLLPGTVALSGSKILSSYVFSQGKPLVNSYITLGALAVTVAADFALIPAFGVSGAAIASTVAYTTHFALSLAAYGRLSGQPVWPAVLPRVGDLREYLADHSRRLERVG